MNASRNIVKASYGFHHGRQKSNSLTNYRVKRDEAAYAYSSLMTDVNAG